eukprot:196016-Amphidinium_carterae.3
MGACRLKAQPAAVRDALRPSLDQITAMVMSHATFIDQTVIDGGAAEMDYSEPVVPQRHGVCVQPHSDRAGAFLIQHQSSIVQHMPPSLARRNNAAAAAAAATKTFATGCCASAAPQPEDNPGRWECCRPPSTLTSHCCKFCSPLEEGCFEGCTGQPSQTN